MISVFPEMEGLSVEDKPAIDSLVRCHPPYSDFTFVNLWSWNSGDTRVACHRGNLVLRFADYLSGEPRYTFLGNADGNETAAAIFMFLRGQEIAPRLALVPECAAEGLDPRTFTVSQSAEHCDYIVDVHALAECEGRAWHRQRNFVNRFTRDLPTAQFRPISGSCPHTRREISRLFEEWCSRREPEDCDTDHEQLALERCLAEFGKDLIVGGVYTADRLIAFSIVEPAPSPYAINHFEKADRWSYAGVLPYSPVAYGVAAARQGRPIPQHRTGFGFARPPT